MEVIRAKKMGFCIGVQEAIKTVDLVLEKYPNRNIYILGMLVHNSQVIKRLNEKGVKELKETNIKKLTSNDVVVVRAHGVSKEIYEALKQTSAITYDAACVFVKGSRKVLEKEEKLGNEIIFIGDKHHPEVKGIVSYGEEVKIISGIGDFINYVSKDKSKNYFVIFQTTLNNKIYKQIIKYINKNLKNCQYKRSICGATYERQISAEELAKEVEAIIVIGGNKSSNTKKLYDICKGFNKKTFNIETVDELDLNDLKDIKKIGITAGASTPEESIIEVEKLLKGGI